MNELEVKFRLRQVVIQPIKDKRYRCLVTLARSDRPRYWSFLCINCGSKLGELMNREVIGIDDFYDPQALQNGGYGRHCKGTLADGLPCHYSYFFNLN